MTVSLPTASRRWAALSSAFVSCLLVLPKLAPAQTAPPAWDLATSGGSAQAGASNSLIQAIAADGRGNIFVTGSFAGTATFGTTTLTSTSISDMFVAKWDGTAQAYTWAIRDGGSNTNVSYAIAVSGTSVFVAGGFLSNASPTIAGQTLSGAGSYDMFVAKYVDTSTGHTPATSSVANGWATSGGGTGNDYGFGIATSGSAVYVTGCFASGSGTSVAGQALSGAGDNDVFVAKYNDTSTTPAASSYANGWATSAGGTGNDCGYGIVANGTGVYVTGFFVSGSGTSVAGQALSGAGGFDAFVAKYNDTSTGSTPATSSFANGWAVSGGGMGSDFGHAIATSGPSVYFTGIFASGGGASLAGQVLSGAGDYDMFVAKYVDTSTGHTPATSSYANGWAVSGGGTGSDDGRSLAVRGKDIFVGGNFGSGTNTTIAGQALAGMGFNNSDVFVAKYVDTSTGSTTATSSVASAWATSGGSLSFDYGSSIAVSGQQVYAGGVALPPATFGPFTLGTSGNSSVNFLARLTDPTLTALPTRPATPAGAGLTLYPNPATGTVLLSNAAPGAVVQVLDALGRVVATATADAGGAARLPAGLAPGVYVVRAGGAAARLAVE